MVEKIEKIIAKYRELEEKMATTEVASDPKQMETIGREYSHIGKILPTITKYKDTVLGLAEAKGILKEEKDPEMRELAAEEINEYEAILPSLEEETKVLLVPKDPIDAKNAMMEIRAGTGGTEAAIFASDLYRMYTSFIESKGWTKEIMNTSYGEGDSLKEIVIMVKGEDAYGTLKYESGVHRVQRVPQTESQGRVHTSAASVAIFPEADDFEFKLDESELKFDVYRASGPGGQCVNTTDSAVRITHIPTNTVVTCQDEKSQHKNRAKALKVLQSRLYEKKRAEVEAQESASRKSMVGSGDRSAKIRTYNYPQGRVTDHRINLTLYKLEEIVNGNVQELIDALAIAETNEKMKED